MTTVVKALTQDELRQYKKSLLGKPYADLSPCEILQQFQFLSSCYAQRKDRKGVSAGLSKTVLKRLNFLTNEIFSGLVSRKQEKENAEVLSLTQNYDPGVTQTLMVPSTEPRLVPGEVGMYEETLIAQGLPVELLTMGK